MSTQDQASCHASPQRWPSHPSLPPPPFAPPPSHPHHYPTHSRAFVLANNDLAFLRARVVETQANGFLEGYRARTREVQKAASKRTAKKGGHLALVKGIVGANHGGQDDDDEDEAKDEDEVVEAAAAKAQQKDGGTGGAGQGAGGGGGGGKGGKSGAAAGAKKEVVLDEDYDD